MAQKSDLISNIEELICIVDQDFEQFSEIIDQIIGYVVKDPNNTSTFISYINIQLSNAPTRKKGLILLNALLPLYQNEIVAEHSIAWINNSLKRCGKEAELSKFSFKIISQLLHVYSKTPELNKSFSSNILNKLISEISLVKIDSNNSFAALKCLEKCLHAFPGPNASFKLALEKYLITFIDAPITSASVRVAGKCLHALQQVGGGGTDGINHKQNWEKQQKRLCATVHSLMNTFFESITEFDDFQQEDIACLELPTISTERVLEKTAYRIINTSIFLQEMLLGAFPVKKSIAPSAILDVISRGLKVTNSTLGTHLLEDSVILLSYLPLIHKHLLHLLQCLFVSLGGNIIPYATTVCFLIVQNLTSIPTEDAANIKALCETRITAYETLQLWMNTVKASSCVHVFLNMLLPAIITDITPDVNEISLMVQRSTTKHLSKKARKKIQDQSTTNFAAKAFSALSGTYTDHKGNFQSSICATALKTLQLILQFEGSLVLPNIHRHFQEFIVKTLYKIHHGSVIYPYSDECCLIELYNTLISLVTCHHGNISPPIEYAVILLTKGLAENNTRISQTCSNGLLILQPFIHPTFASLELPIDINNLKAELNIEMSNSVVHFEESDDENEINANEILIHSITEKESSKQFASDQILEDLNLEREHLEPEVSQCDNDQNISIIQKETDAEQKIEEKPVNKTQNVSDIQDKTSSEQILEVHDKYINATFSEEEETMETLVMCETDDLQEKNNSNQEEVKNRHKSDDEKTTENQLQSIISQEQQEGIDKITDDSENQISRIEVDDKMEIDEEEMCKTFVDITNE